MNGQHWTLFHWWHLDRYSRWRVYPCWWWWAFERWCHRYWRWSVSWWTCVQDGRSGILYRLSGAEVPLGFWAEPGGHGGMPEGIPKSPSSNESLQFITPHQCLFQIFVRKAPKQPLALPPEIILHTSNVNEWILYLYDSLITWLRTPFIKCITTLWAPLCRVWYTKALVLEWKMDRLSRVDEESILASLTSTSSLSDQVVVYCYTSMGIN